MLTKEAALAQVIEDCASDGLTSTNGEKVAVAIANAFGVKHDEVAILRIEGQNLAFVYPAKLQNVGTIPVNTSGSVAGRTVATKRAETMNNFAQTKHATIFESVNLDSKPPEFGERVQRAVIQKLMTAPVIGPGGVVGVIQISRKGTNPPAAGPDFTPADLQRLVRVAGDVAKCFKQN